MLQQFKALPRENYLMILAVFFMKAGQFMVMPFLAIYLQHFPHATPTKIGIAIGLGPLTYGVFSPLGGWLIDRFGCRLMTSLTLLASAFNIFFYFSVQAWWYCFGMGILLGLTRCLFDISSRTYRLIELPLALRRFVFSLRFTAINAAAGLGPLLGALFASQHSLLIFHLIGAWYLLLSLVSWRMLRPDPAVASREGGKPALKTMWHVLSKDRTLAWLIVASLLFWVGFAQIDSTLPQYLQTIIPNSLNLYAALLMINALMCAGLQIIINHLLQNIEVHWANRVGVGLFILYFVLLAIATQASTFVIAIVLMTLAELLLAPAQDYVVSLIATPQHIGSYYGVLGIATLGIGFGPIIGGMIYQHSSGSLLFLCCVGFSLLMAYGYERVFAHLKSLNLEATPKRRG